MSFRKTAFGLLWLLGAATLFAAADVTEPIGTAAELFSATYSENDVKARRFALTATVTLPCCERRHRTMAIEDKTGSMLVTLDRISDGFRAERGDIVELKGVIAADSFGHPCAACASARVVSRGTTPTPTVRSLSDISSPGYRCRVFEIEGVVADAFTDEIDPNYMFIILDRDGQQVTVATEADGRTSADCQQMIGRHVAVLGACRPNTYGVRTHFGPNIRTTPENIRFTDACQPDPFDAVELSETRFLRPDEIASSERRRVRGTVIAAWTHGRALVRTADGQPVKICVSHGDPPEQGEVIEAVGFPETDLYRINLTRCLCRTTGGDGAAEGEALALTVRQITCDTSGRLRYNMDYHGKRVLISGRLLGYSPPDGAIEKALLESDGRHIPVYFSARHEISKKIPVDSLVEIDGTCVMDTESWSPYTFFPRIQEVLISVAGPDRIRVIALPSWWTPAKFTAVCVALLAVLCGIMLWNLTLNRIVARKSRQLKKEITARLASNLKTRERTRLAVELHDSIAQTLSGTAMEIGSALRCAENASEAMMAHLQTASQTLRSCRDDLRDCLWDLRSNALEVNSMDEAIQTTLRPIIGELKPVIRFNVQRKRLSDNTAHALLRIIHELVSNAIRHGQAKTVRIAGSLDGRRLLFSVRDDGCGFDIGNHPGAADGHFGLEGIRERIRRFNGTMEIDSAPAQGTKVTIVLDVSLPEEEDLFET